MKFLNYLKYFFFIAVNWNIKLAYFTIRNEIRGERKYGIKSTGTDQVKGIKVTEDILTHAEQYQGANYFLLEKMFEFLHQESSAKKIIDFGCGKGRILAVAAFYGFNEIKGVEISDELATDAEQNINLIKPNYPLTKFEIVKQNAADYLIDDTISVFFFFNPFDEVIMLQVVKNILNSLKKNDREIFIGYINPVHKEIFQSAGFIEVFHLQKYLYLECSILLYTPWDEQSDDT